MEGQAEAAAACGRGLVGVEGAAPTAGLGVATRGPKLGVWPVRQSWAWGQAERTFGPHCSPRGI